MAWKMCKNFSFTHRRSMTLLLLLFNLPICFTEKHIFKIITYFLIHQNVPQMMSFHLRYMMVSTNFEAAVKTGKLATPPWLSCQYNVNTLVDLLSSWLYQNIFIFTLPMLYLYKEMPKLLICPLYYACCHLSKVCTLVFFYAYYLVNLVSFNYEFLGMSFNWNGEQSF